MASAASPMLSKPTLPVLPLAAKQTKPASPASLWQRTVAMLEWLGDLSEGGDGPR